MVNFQTINNDLLIAIPTVSDTTKAGLIKSPAMIKAEEDKSDKFYKVISAGGGCKYIKEGDMVYVTGKHQQIELEGALYAIVNELHILGKKIN